MEWLKGVGLFGVSFGVVFCAVTFANAQEISFVSNPVWLSTMQTSEGETVQASTVITKSGGEAVEGEVEFFSNGKGIGTKSFSLPPNVGGVVVTVSFSPEEGEHLVSAKVVRATVERGGEDVALKVAGEVKAGETLKVAPDTRTRTSAAESESVPAVAGASTTATAGEVAETAKTVGAKMFAQTEAMRNSAANYFDTKLEETAVERAAKQDVADDFEDVEDVVAKPRSLGDQVKDTSGIIEGLKLQMYKAGAFLFGNMYAFYIFTIVLVLWILRKIWRRHSLD